MSWMLQSVFHTQGITMEKIEPQPNPDTPLVDSMNGKVYGRSFNYLFVVDFVGSTSDPRYAIALDYLEKNSEFYRVLGSYLKHKFWEVFEFVIEDNGAWVRARTEHYSDVAVIHLCTVITPKECRNDAFATAWCSVWWKQVMCADRPVFLSKEWLDVCTVRLHASGSLRGVLQVWFLWDVKLSSLILDYDFLFRKNFVALWRSSWDWFR